MVEKSSVVLFGVKSPLVVEYEETCLRAGVDLAAGVSLGGSSRLLARDRLLAIEDWDGRFAGLGFLPCAFAAQNRRLLCDRAFDLGLSLYGALVDPHAVVASSSKLGAGCYVNAGAVIGGASILGRCVIVNRSASIGHHCLIADFVSIGPGATIASNVRIGEGATVGAGATILPDVRVGEKAVVAGGALVRQEVPPDTVVFGNPAAVSPLRPDQTRVWRNDQE